MIDKPPAPYEMRRRAKSPTCAASAHGLRAGRTTARTRIVPAERLHEHHRLILRPNRQHGCPLLGARQLRPFEDNHTLYCDTGCEYPGNVVLHTVARTVGVKGAVLKDDRGL